MKSLEDGFSNVVLMILTLIISYSLTLTIDTTGVGFGELVYNFAPGFFMFLTFIGHFWLKKHVKKNAWVVTVLGCAFNIYFSLGLRFDF